MAGTSRGESWLGGYIRVTKAGRRIYVIHGMLGGRQYEVSTNRSMESEALAELARLERKPAAYSATPDPDLTPAGPAPIYLDAALIKRYLAYCAEGPRPCTRNWWNMKRRFLEQWMVKLNGVDLRGGDLDVILAAIDGATSVQHRIATIKHV